MNCRYRRSTGLQHFRQKLLQSLQVFIECEQFVRANFKAHRIWLNRPRHTDDIQGRCIRKRSHVHLLACVFGGPDEYLQHVPILFASEERPQSPDCLSARVAIRVGKQNFSNAIRPWHSPPFVCEGG